MKSILPAVACIAIIIAGCVVNAVCMNRITKNASDMVLESFSQAENGNMDDALESALGMESYWKDRHEYLASVLIHAELDDITVTISDYVSAAQIKDMDEFSRQVRLLIVQLDHMSELEQLTVSNVL